MNLNNPQSMGIPRQNPAFPMAQLQDNHSSGMYNYNQPTEVVGGYDARINPMTGQEIPQTNFAGGGLASLVASPYRDSDVMQVKMTPREVAGLQQLAMSYGAMPEDLYDPVTGQPQFSFLKKLLPTLIGATLNTFAPGIGRTVGNLIPGLSEAAASTIGTGLVVGGAYGLIEGDLKKGLEAGLGAYSGANIAQSLQASAMPAPVRPGAEEMAKVRTEMGLRDLDKVLENTGMTEAATQAAMPSDGLDYFTSANKFRGTPTAIDLAAGRQGIARDMTGGGIGAGIKGLFTSPDSRKAFGQSLGGGFESPFMQQIAKTATFSGVANALSPDPKQLPTGSAMGEDYMYIPGGFNPLYGTGRDQPYQLPGKYYKRTPQGLVPFNPFALAPGRFAAAGGEIQSYADGGIVDPNRDPGGAVLLPGPQTPYTPYFTNPVSDPNVAATRAYIEELNRRAKNPPTYAYPGMGGTGLGGTNRPYVPEPSTGGGGGGGGDGSLTGSPVGDLIAGVGGQYLAQKGIEKGFDYLRDKFTTGPEDLQEVEVTGKKVGEPTAEDLAAGKAANLANLAGLPSLVPTPAPAGTMDVGMIDESGNVTYETPGQPAPTTATIDPYAVTSAVSGLTSINPALGRVRSIGDEVVVNASRDAAWNAAYDKALDAARESGLTGEAASDAAGKYADASTSGIGASLKNWAFKDPSAGFSGGIGNLKGGFTPPTTAMGTAAAVLGAYNTAKSIEAGKEGRAAFDAFMTAAQFGGPITAIAAAAIAALGASMVTTKEFGDKALENYWKAVDSGRGIGQTPPEELAQGFINFYRTNKNEFPGQAKYGRTGNEDFVYDMTQVINKAVKDGTVDKGANAAVIYEKAVQPWLNTMGEGPKNEDARRVQDFMMTDLINSFMQGKPISNAQVKGDKKFKIVSERPVFAGTAPADMQVDGQMPANFQGRPGGIPEGAGREGLRTPFSEIEMQEAAPPTPFSEPQAAAPPPTPFSEPRELAPVSTPYSPRIIEEEAAAPMPPAPVSKMADFVAPALPPPTPFSEPEPRDYIPTPFSEPQAAAPPPPTPFSEPEPTYYRQEMARQQELARAAQEQAAAQAARQQEMVRQQELARQETARQSEREREFEREYIQPIMTPFSEPEREYMPPPYMPTYEPEPFANEDFMIDSNNASFYAGGGAVGEDYNFGFARGGMPNEYQAGGKLLDGPGDGMSDDIPAVIRGKGVQRAALADGEFVVPADVVSHLGNGSTKAGAKKLYDMMARVRQARTGKARQAPAVKTGRLLPA